MGALFAGIIRAPLTSVFMIFELTQDYQILVPLMITNMLSFGISRHFQAKPLYRALLEQDGVHMPDVTTRASTSIWRAGDVMMREFLLLPTSTPIARANQAFSENGMKCLPVGDGGALAGLVTREQVQHAIRTGLSEKTVSSILLKEFPHTHQDHPIDIVLARLGDSPGLLPVLDRTSTEHLDGIITLENVTHFVEGKWKDEVEAGGPA